MYTGYAPGMRRGGGRERIGFSVLVNDLDGGRSINDMQAVRFNHGVRIRSPFFCLSILTLSVSLYTSMYN